jgi:hypothetical protein
MTKGENHDVLIDLLVPARFASRYWAVVTALSPQDASLRFAFCPSVFGSGVVVSCPATLSVHRGLHVTGTRGILWAGRDSQRTTARFEFEQPISSLQTELLRRVCHINTPTPPPLVELVPVAASLP